MRVTIQHKQIERKRKYQVEVSVSVQFTELELAVLKGWRLTTTHLAERKFDSVTEDAAFKPSTIPHSLRVNDLLGTEPDRWTFDRPSDAKVYEQKVVESLKMLKNLVEWNSELSKGITLEI